MEIKKETAVTVQEKNISDGVLNRVKELEKEGNLQFPANYSYSNALKSAWLQLQEITDKDGKPALQVCTKNSIADSLLNMVIQGLSPAKHQCWFIVRGNKLCCDKSYFGTVAAAKRMSSVKNVVANCIYEGDVFEYDTLDLETGEKKIRKHEQKFENIDNAKIKGAYAIVIPKEGPNHIEIMTMPEIKASWSQGPMKGNSGAHKNFPDQMAMRTVINRACKMYVNTSDDSDLFAEAFNSDEKTYDDKDLVDGVDYEVKEEIKEEGNAKVIDIQPETVKEDKKEAKSGQQSFGEPEF